MKLINYGLNNNENIYYIFEIKVRDGDNNKFVFRKVKQSKEGNLINILDELSNITNIKIKIFDINDPSNIISLKVDINSINNTIVKNNNLILHVSNNEYFILNYRFIN